MTCESSGIGSARSDPGREPAQDPGRQEDAERTAGERQQQRFAHQLCEQAAGARADRRSNRELAPASRRARQHQAADVAACDQQHRADRAEEHEHGEANVANELIAKRHEVDRPAGVEVRLLGAHLREDALHFRLRLIARDVGFHASDADQAPAAKRHLRRQLIRQESIGGESEDFETARHDADHRDGRAVDRQLLSDDAGAAAELAEPRRVRQDHRPGRTLAVFPLRKAASERRPDAQHVQDVRRHDQGRKLLRLTGARQRRAVLRERRHAVERSAALAPRQEVRGTDHVARPVARQVVFPHHHQRVGVLVGQRPDQQRMHDAEQRRRRADANRKGRDRADGEQGSPEQHANAVLQIR